MVKPAISGSGKVQPQAGVVAYGSTACYLQPRIGYFSSRGHSPRLARGPSASPELLPHLPLTGQQASRCKGTSRFAKGGAGGSAQLPMLQASGRPSPKVAAMKHITPPLSPWDFFLLTGSPQLPEEEEIIGDAKLDAGSCQSSVAADGIIQMEEIGELEAIQEKSEPSPSLSPSASVKQVEVSPPLAQVSAPLPDLMLLEPNFAAICRDTFQASCTQREQIGAEATHRRRQRDIAMRRQGRQKAAAWRRAADEREKQETEDLRALKQAQEKAKREEEELVQYRAKMRKIRWLLVKERLNGEEKQTGSGVVDTRIDTQRKAKLKEKRLQRKAQRHEAHKSYFESLPLRRRRMFEDVFSIYDSDVSGSLQAPELCECLEQMGFRGHDPEERRAVQKIVENAVHANMQVDDEDGGIDMYELAADIIPTVCRQLNKLRKVAFLETLNSIDTAEDGKIDYEQVIDAVKEVWPLEFLGDNADDTNAEEVSLKQHFFQFTRMYVDEKANLAMYLEEVGRIAEDGHWNTFTLQQAVKAEHDLSPDLFRQFRREIIHLDRLFKSVDIDNSGKLDREECTRLFKEMGIIARTTGHQDQAMRQLARGLSSVDDGGADFPSFLALITQSRAILEKRLKKKLKRVYPPWAKDEGATVTRNYFMTSLLKDVDVLPRDAKEQRIIHAVTREADVDGDDRYTLAEVVRICRKSQERLREKRQQGEMAAALGIGFSEAELNQFRWAFEQLDDDRSGALDKTETRKAMELLGKSCSHKQFATAFEKLDVDRSGSLELIEFLQLMNFLQNPEAFDNVADNVEDIGEIAPRRPSLLSRAANALDKRTSFAPGT